uniref:Uncharacterized protein n=1 Tax=Anopheles culicifacies TaxID=139723 RepID=A0A182LW53_9DIPT
MPIVHQRGDGVLRIDLDFLLWANYNVSTYYVRSGGFFTLLAELSPVRNFSSGPFIPASYSWIRFKIVSQPEGKRSDGNDQTYVRHRQMIRCGVRSLGKKVFQLLVLHLNMDVFIDLLVQCGDIEEQALVYNGTYLRIAWVECIILAKLLMKFGIVWQLARNTCNPSLNGWIRFQIVLDPSQHRHATQQTDVGDRQMIGSNKRTIFHERFQQFECLLQLLHHFIRWFQLFLQNTLHILDGSLVHYAIVEEQSLVHDRAYLRIFRIERIVFTVLFHQVDDDGIGGPISCRMPFTNRLIPYDDVSRSVPNISAMMTAVMPTYVPEASPNKPQNKLTIV